MRLRHSFLITAIFLIAGTGFADPPSEAAKAEMKKLEGIWKVTSFQKDGADFEALVQLELEFVFKEQALQIKSSNPNFKTLEKFYQLEPGTDPKLLDVADSAKDLKDRKQVFEGLYSLENETLKWCFTMNGDQPAFGNRPPALESKAGTSTILITLKRSEK